ncbi:ubiquitin carboxyl-terminal hydrolase 5-like [Tubulanus polymorphus]|uniref:ubiquitin carboxyl-terminal hydrolase 5-like n=1 Tax=Tubulanus polymorphus TaxID=672921 RepID=UPI003DA1DFF6
MAASSIFNSEVLSKVRTPSVADKVFKDECVYSFDSPDCETGLYVCMNTFLGLGKDFVEEHFNKTRSPVYLHLKRIRREIPASDDDDEPMKKKPTKLAIGVEGGFALDEKKYEYEERHSIIVLPRWVDVPLDSPDIPELVQISAATIIAIDPKAEEAALLQGTWEGDKRVVSKHAENLVQLDNGIKIPPKGWKCSMCDKTDNLWLNLTDGTILCGRKFWDGSGGNNHAVDHFKSTGYPLAVKLGTITSDAADVFSYDEDDMVEDPHLAKHLAHFGINIAQLEKTEKTMIELEIDLNQKIGEWDVIQEAGSELQPLYGPGLTGMHNLGNSCYMNSVMQVLFTLPDFQKRYAVPLSQLIAYAPQDPSNDFGVQMSKLGRGLSSGKYSKPPVEVKQGEPVPPDQGIRPKMFKSLVGRGHAEFSTKRQQDVQEYLLHLINLIERNSRGSSNPCDCFRYQVEEKIQCMQSKKVKYTHRDDFLLALPIPLETAVNKDEVMAYETKKAELEANGQKIDAKELVRPRVSLLSCIEAFSAAELVDDFFSTAINAKSTAQKMTRLATFPDYLFVQLKKFTIGDDWVPKKLDVSIDVPGEIDLTRLRGKGLEQGEELLPETTDPTVQQLVDMGFALEGCKRAVFHTQNRGVEAAMEWVIEHMGDPDFATPFSSGQKTTRNNFTPNEEAVTMIMGMGFLRDQAIKALKETDNNLERAANWIFSHAQELDQAMETEAENEAYRDGSGKYKLVAFISHMGTSTMVGHYLCHILKDDRWVIFNDEKVALSANPPRDLGYIYLFRRI